MQQPEEDPFQTHFNPFQANAPFLCPLKTAKKQIFSTFSGGIKKRTLV